MQYIPIRKARDRELTRSPKKETGHLHDGALDARPYPYYACRNGDPESGEDNVLSLGVSSATGVLLFLSHPPIFSLPQAQPDLPSSTGHGLPSLTLSCPFLFTVFLFFSFLTFIYILLHSVDFKQP